MSTNSEGEACENNEENVEVAKEPERPGTPDIQCSICLDAITDVCHTNICRHSFCYKCLKRWSTIESFCPLCKRNFNSIHHSFTEDGLYQVYDVLVWSSNIPASEPEEPFFEMVTRVVVYHQNMWIEPLSDLNGRFRDVNSRFFRENPEQTIRLHEFIQREIFVLMVLQSNQTHGQLNTLRILNRGIEFITNSIISLISVYEIMGGEIVNMLQPYIGHYTLHFCHELYNFANCPYDELVDYDRNASYLIGISNLPISEQFTIMHQIQIATRMLSYIETIVPNSDEENIETDARRTPPEVIIHESSSNESDVKIDGIMSCPIETHESPSAGQPSTSTGIGHSVEPPNNKFNPTTRRFTSGRTRTVDCSSSDDSTISSSSDLQTISRKRKRQFDTNSSKRIKNSTSSLDKESTSHVHTISRKRKRQTTVERRSYLESSSSDDEDI